MAVGKSSIKRAMESNEAAKADSIAKGTVVKKAEAKAALKSAVSKSKAVAAKNVIASTNEQVFATVSQSEGINAHYGLNTPLPTFLL